MDLNILKTRTHYQHLIDWGAHKCANQNRHERISAI